MCAQSGTHLDQANNAWPLNSALCVNNIMFQIHNHETEINKLILKLEALGLSLVEKREEYSEIVWLFSCKWINEPIEIVWEQQWVNDGTEKEETGYSIKKGKSTLKSLTFTELQQNKRVPLIESIKSSIQGIVSDITGKHA